MPTQKENIEKEKPHIGHFEYADFCGYASVNITEDRKVLMSIYANADKEAWTTVNLSALL